MVPKIEQRLVGPPVRENKPEAKTPLDHLPPESQKYYRDQVLREENRRKTRDRESAFKEVDQAQKEQKKIADMIYKLIQGWTSLLRRLPEDVPQQTISKIQLRIRTLNASLKALIMRAGPSGLDLRPEDLEQGNVYVTRVAVQSQANPSEKKREYAQEAYFRTRQRPPQNDSIKDKRPGVSEERG